MNESRSPAWGRIDDKGHWKPPQECGYAPLFSGGFKPRQLLKFFFGWGGYIYPRNILYVALAYVSWNYLQPPLETFQTLTFLNVGILALRNLALLWIVFGGYHLVFYTLKYKGTRAQKYHPKGQETASRKFLFNNQVKDNLFRASTSGVIVWTAYETLYFYLLANGRLPMLEWAANPVWFVALFFLIPLWRETHFYFIHKLIHWKPLMQTIHTVHHKNPNPGPWSGMSMHPVEHLLYFSVVLIHFVVPSHPLHLIFNAQHTALTPAGGHTGYEGSLLWGLWPFGSYFHYLHHKHVSCNYGEATIPWDRWFGRFFDGEGRYTTKKK